MNLINNPTKAATNSGANQKQQPDYNNSRLTQQQKIILEWLYQKPLTTIEARQVLGIMHPAGRVQELRELGYNIVTHWTTVDTGKAKHSRVASYVLLARG